MWKLADSVAVMDNMLLSYCGSLKSVALPGGVMGIGADVFFGRSENLAIVTVPLENRLRSFHERINNA